MTDIRADETAADEEDRLPWLEAVDEDEERDGPSPMKLVAAVLVGLVAIGLVVSGLFWLGNRNNGEGPPETITADQGDYKVRPENPGGMQVQGAGQTALAASEGAEPKGTLNVDAVPEAPVAKPARTASASAPKPAAQPTKPAPQPAPVRQAEATPATPPAATSGGGQVQLGAFSSSAAANNAWKALSTRFKYLQPLTHSVIPVTAGGRTLYRLRASGPNASGLCGRLRVAGETCVSVS